VRSSASFVSFISESGKSKVSLGLRRETSGVREQPAIPVQISLKPRNGVSEDEGEDEGEEEETDVLEEDFGLTEGNGEERE